MVIGSRWTSGLAQYGSALMPVLAIGWRAGMVLACISLHQSCRSGSKATCQWLMRCRWLSLHCSAAQTSTIVLKYTLRLPNLSSACLTCNALQLGSLLIRQLNGVRLTEAAESACCLLPQHALCRQPGYGTGLHRVPLSSALADSVRGTVTSRWRGSCLPIIAVRPARLPQPP